MNNPYIQGLLYNILPICKTYFIHSERRNYLAYVFGSLCGNL